MRAATKTVSTLALLLVALPVNAALTAVALLRSLVVEPRRAVRGRPEDDPGQRRQDDQGAAARPLLPSGGASGDPRRVAQVPAHRAPVLAGGGPLLHRPGPAGGRLRRRAGRDRAPGGGGRLRPGVQPGRQPLRRAGEAGRRTARSCTSTSMPRAGSTTSTRSRSPRRRSASPCPTRTASPTRSRCSTSTSPPSGRTYILKSIAVRPGPAAGPDAATAAHAGRDGRVRAHAADLPGATRGSCRSSSTARSTARTARCATGTCSCTAAASRRRSRSTTRWSNNPEIEAWVRRFVGALGLTGQVSFDFIRSADGAVYAIECNPRTHSAITMFYDHPGRGAGLPARTASTRSGRRATSRPTYWIYHELWRLRHAAADAPPAAGARSRAGRTRSSTGPIRCRS